jgi:hypothetical protein
MVQIQHRSPVLQRPLPLPPRPAGQAPLPVAIERPKVGRLGCFLSLIILAGALAPVVIGIVRCAGKLDPTAALKQPRWYGAGVLLTDLNGDGVDDLVARLRVLRPNDQILVAGFDGKSGKRLWRSEKIGEYGQISHSPMALAGGCAVVADDRAGLIAIAVKDGGVRWRIRLNEVVERLCAGPTPEALVAVTKDGRQHVVAVADGAVSAVDGGDCAPLPSGSADGPPPGWVEDRTSRHQLSSDAIAGMSVSELIVERARGRALILGSKHPGTSIPMIALARLAPKPTPDEPEEVDPSELHRRLSEEKDPARRRELVEALRRVRVAERPVPEAEVVWSTLVPGVDPMTVDPASIDVDEVGCQGDHLAIAYEVKDGAHDYRLAAFDLADGARRWDVVIDDDSPHEAVVVTATHVLVSRWEKLMAYDLATGARAYAIE